MLDTPRPSSSSNIGAWIGFLAATFCVVGLIGLFSTYAAPLAYQRELRREQMLDQVLVTPPGQLAALRDALGDSADAVLSGAGPIADRVATERLAMRARLEHEADETAERLRLEIVIVTLTGAVLGGVMLGMQKRG